MPSKNKPLLLRGSLIVLRRKCGKLACHCADGDPHETPALSYSVKGVTKILTLRQKDILEVKAALARYRRSLSSLDRQALDGIAALRKRIYNEKRTRR
jgi:hypothetical protein